MEYSFSKRKISMEKVMSDLDRFVFDLCSLLEKEGIRYVVVSGYVAIVFGRSRNTEDIDILIERLDFDRFEKLWNVLSKRYECQNTTNVKDAYYDYLMKKTAIRFSKERAFIPNFEFKFMKDEKDKYSLENSITLKINKESISISPLELQIAYKLLLGSVKDVEDARFLFKLFTEQINKEELKAWLRELNILETTVQKLGVPI